MKVITKSMIVEMNRLYNSGKNCKIIANKINVSPYTVKKYIDNYKEEEISEKNIFEGRLPKFNSETFRGVDWGELCVLTKEETEEIRKLWEEIEF